jgi:phosphoribosylanthranilate isomerase
MTTAKICGLTTAAGVEAAVAGGASHLGFVFFERSPRRLTVDQARELAEAARGRTKIVALFVDADRRLIDEVVEAVACDMIQLHGAETPAFVSRLKRDHRLPVIRALGVRDAADLARLDEWEAVADHLLVDARAPQGAERPGGHGAAFDWSLLAGRRFTRPWFLAGGLNAANVGEAVRTLKPDVVDVSSGVEGVSGVKEPALIAAFLAAVKDASRGAS